MLVNMDIKRVISALLGFPLVVIILTFGNKYVVDIFLAIIAAIAMQEFFNAVGFSKILTALIALESGKTQMPVTISEKAYNGLKAATLYDLVNIMLITQNNVAALNIAQAVAGSVEEFVKLMNKKSAQIGALNTLFSNPTGVSGVNYTTAEDACKLMEYAIQNKHFCDIFKRKSYTVKFNEEDKTFSTTNPMLTEGNNFYIKECI